MAEKAQVYSTMKDAVVDMFFKQVLEQSIPKKINENETLLDLVPKEFEEFADDMVIVYLDKIARVFNVPSAAMKNKPLGQILASLENSKKQAAKYGNRPIKRSQYRKY